jgi:hypothetical protein
MKNNHSAFFALTLFTLILSSCYYDNIEELYVKNPADSAGVCDTTKVMSFATDIQPILTSNCGSNNNSCHGALSTVLSLSDYAGVKSTADAGKLVGVITWASGFSPMPKGSTSKIDACSIGKIKKWVSAGSPNN